MPSRVWFTEEDVAFTRKLLRAALTTKHCRDWPGVCDIMEAHKQEAMTQLREAWRGEMPTEEQVWCVFMWQMTQSCSAFGDKRRAQRFRQQLHSA